MTGSLKIKSRTVIKLIVAPILAVTLMVTGIPTGDPLDPGPTEVFANEDELVIEDDKEPAVLDETDQVDDPKQYNLSLEGGPTDVIRKLEYEQLEGEINDFYGKKYKTGRPIDISKLVDDGIYGRNGSAMLIPGYHFDGWYVNEVDDGEKNRLKAEPVLNPEAGFEIEEKKEELKDANYFLKLFTDNDVVIKANYVPDTYYVGYAANSEEAKNYHDNVIVNSTGGDFSVIKPAAIGTSDNLSSDAGSGPAWSTEAGTDGKKLRGWMLAAQDGVYSVSSNSPVYGLGEPITQLIDGEDPDFVISEIENGSAMLLKEGEGTEVSRAVDNWMIAYYDYDHQLTLLDDKGNEIGEYADFSETDVLPTEVSDPDGKTLYRWAKADENGKATGTVFEPGKTLSDDGRKLENAFETETREDGTNVKKLTLVATFEDTYTFNLRNGDETEYGWTVGRSKIEETPNLRDFIYARLAEDYKDRIRAFQNKVEDTDWKYSGNTDAEVVADMVSDGALFAPSQEGKHFDLTDAKNNISYKENKDAVTETKANWTVSMNMLMDAADEAQVPNTLDINLLLEDNTYRVSYFYQDLVEMPEHTYGGMYENQIGDEILVDGDGHFSTHRKYQTNRMEFLIRDGQQEVKYAEPTQIPFNAESPQITDTIKWGELIGWKVVEFKYVRDDLGLPFLTELGKRKREYITLGFLKAGDKMEKLTTTQNGDVRLIGQYMTRTYVINFENGADQLNGGTPTGRINSVEVTMDEERKVLNRFEANGYSITNWFVDGNRDKKVYPRWNLLDEASEEWETQMNILNTRDILLKADLNNTTITAAPIWEPHDVTVTYHPNGGKLEPAKVNNREVFDEAIGQDIVLTNPTGPAGYIFGGWFFDKGFGRELAVNDEGEGKTWSIPANTGSEIDVYAKWVPRETTVTFNSNYPADLGMTAEKHTETYAYNADVIIRKPAFNAAGYTLVGWSETSDGPVDYPATGKASFSFESDTLNLYAVWAKSGDEFPITILSDVQVTVPDGWIQTEEKLTASFKFGTSMSLPKLVPADELGKKNYTFKGYVDKYGNTVKSISRKTVGPQILYARWTGKKYAVTYYANAPQGFKASGKMAKQSVRYGDDWAPQNCRFEVQGWRFIGWGETKDAVNPLYDFRATGRIGEVQFTAPFNLEKWTYTENRKLYGIWEAAEDSIRLYTGYPKPGYEGSQNHIRIKGWEMETDPNGESSGYFHYNYKTSDLVNGRIKLPTAEDMTDTQGMTFKGWYKANLVGDEAYGTKGKKVTTVKAGDHTLYMAKWSGKVTINYWNGNECVSETADIGKKVKLRNMPMAWKDKDKILAGWAIGDHLHAMWKPGERVDWDVIENSSYLLRTTVNSTTMDLYAVWVPVDKTYTVTYYDTSKSVVAVGSFSYSKGISEKQLRKIGNSIVKNDPRVSRYKGFKYYHSPNEILGGEENLKLIRKVPKKTAGNLELIIAESSYPRKVKLSFNKNAPAGVKVKGQIGKKTVKEGSGILLLKGFNRLKAKGYDLVGFSLRKDGSRPVYDVVNGGSVLLLDNITIEHQETKDCYHNFENSVFYLANGGSATLYAVWEEVTSKKDSFCYYDLAADDAVFDAEVPLADTEKDYAKHKYDESGNLIGWDNLGLLAPHTGPNQTDHWYQFIPAGDKELGIDGYTAGQVLPIPTRPGYTFAGWIEKNAQGRNVRASALSGDTIRYLTATWTKVK